MIVKNIMIKENVQIGSSTIIYQPCNLYGCVIGNHCFIGPFTEIQDDVVIGNHCRIQSHSFICTGVTMGNFCFIGHGVIFTNDKHPSVKATEEKTWQLNKTCLGKNVSIGSNATVLPVRIGDNAIVGAGAVVTHDVAPNTIVKGNPAK